MSNFKLISDDFDHKDKIPNVFTCDADNVSPRLRWLFAPNETASFAIIVDDPDAMREKQKDFGRAWHHQGSADIKGPKSKRPFVHWVIYNIPKELHQLGQGLEKNEELNDGIHQGYNDFGRIGYDGPCPPKGHGEHNYRFRIYALDKKLYFDEAPTKDELVDAIAGHTIGQAELIGVYEAF